MSKWTLRIVAILLGVGALIFAIVGYRLSTSPAPQTPVRPAIPSSVVFALHDLAAGAVVKPEDISVKTVPDQIADSYAQTGDVVGRLVRVNIAANMVLLHNQLGVPGNLAALLDPQERAVSVKVDDVVGVGGLIKPNDRVDVLLFLQGNPETASISSAQIVLKNARVLAYGDDIAVPAADVTAADAAKKDDDKEKKGRVPEHKSNTTAVLAVPEYELSRFMLAATTGTLKLALRPSAAISDAAAQSPSAEKRAQYTRLGALAYSDARRPSTSAGVAAPAKAGAAAPAKNIIMVYEGGKARAVEVPR
jgi:pilus assembly protein CpaB